jgi:hypothetical protein
MELSTGFRQTTSVFASSLGGVEAVASIAGVACQFTTDGAETALEDASDGAHAQALLVQQRGQGQASLWLQMRVMCSYWGNLHDVRVSHFGLKTIHL